MRKKFELFNDNSKIIFVFYNTVDIFLSLLIFIIDNSKIKTFCF